MLENGVHNRKAQEFLESQLDSIKSDSYALAVVTYALHLADSERKADAFRMLEELRIEEQGETPKQPT